MSLSLRTIFLLSFWLSACGGRSPLHEEFYSGPDGALASGAFSGQGATAGVNPGVGGALLGGTGAAPGVGAAPGAGASVSVPGERCQEGAVDLGQPGCGWNDRGSFGNVCQGGEWVGQCVDPDECEDGDSVDAYCFLGQTRGSETNIYGSLCINGRWDLAPCQLEKTARVSLSSEETESSLGPNGQVALSHDGSIVAFASAAEELLPGDNNGATDVFVRDLRAGTTTLISQNAQGELGRADSLRPSLSADGRFVAFQSYADNLVAEDQNGMSDVFVHDRNTGVTTLVSRSSSGAYSNGFSSSAAISADGYTVAFLSEATNLVPSDENGVADAFVYNTESGTTTLVSLGEGDVQAEGATSSLALSRDGRWVAFSSLSANLISQDLNLSSDIFLRDLEEGTTRIATQGITPDSTGMDFYYPALSANGASLAFNACSSLFANLDQEFICVVMVLQLDAGQLELTSLTQGESFPNGSSFAPSISAGGDLVAFGSKATNLGASDDNGTLSDVFIHERSTKRTWMASVGNYLTQGNGPSASPSLSGDGNWVGYWSEADNLVRGDSNEVSDIFVAVVEAPTIR